MLVLPAELTHVQASTCLDMLTKAAHAEKDPHLLVDATALARFDSSALAVLLACRREALHDGKTFSVRGLSARLQDLATLYGIQDLLHGAPLPSESPPTEPPPSQ